VIIDDKKNTDKSVREVQEQVKDGEEVLNPDHSSSVQNIILNSINDKFDHKCLDEAVNVLNLHVIDQSPDACVPGRMKSIAAMPGT
jgi:hypothetical protein